MERIDIENLPQNQHIPSNLRAKGAKTALLVSVLAVISVILGIDLTTSIRHFLGYVTRCAHQEFNITLY